MTSNPAAADALGCVLKSAVGGAAHVGGIFYLTNFYFFIMPKFARIIELENEEQVVITVEYDSVEDCFKTVIMTDTEDCTAKMKHGFSTREGAMNLLNSYSIEQARDLRKLLIEMYQ